MISFRSRFRKLVIILTIICCVLATQRSMQNFIIDLLINLVIFSGESFTEQNLISPQDQAEITALNQQIQSAQQAYANQQQQLSTQTSTALSQLSQTFTNQLNTLTTTATRAQERLNAEVTYVQRLVNLSIPTELFFTGTPSPSSLEKLFAAAPMYVPKSIGTWYNVFGTSAIGSSDWEYDEDLGIFVQRGPLGNQPAYIANTLGNPQLWDASAAAAEQNQIFTEYITNQASYQVEIDITLINAAYPFCAGILFNKMRWISGSPERMLSYRFVGLYGTQTNSTPTVNFYAGQTTVTSLAGLFVPTTPLQQIINGSLQPLYTLDSSDTALIGKEPLTYRITILTQEPQVTITLSKISAKGLTQLSTTTLTNLDPLQSQVLFWYQGIGFMAPGCQASFKILAPQELVHTRSSSSGTANQQT